MKCKPRPGRECPWEGEEELLLGMHFTIHITWPYHSGHSKGTGHTMGGQSLRLKYVTLTNSQDCCCYYLLIWDTICKFKVAFNNIQNRERKEISIVRHGGTKQKQEGLCRVVDRSVWLS